MRKNRYIVVLVMINCLLMPLLASASTLNIRAHLVQHSIQVFFLSDFNFTGASGNSPLIFELHLSNLVGTSRQAELKMTIISGRYGELAQGTTNPFVLQPFENIYLTNQNLFLNSQRFSFRDYSIESAVDELKDKILASGRLPEDIYTFKFELCDYPRPANPDCAEDFIEIDVTNPTTIDLIAPGSRVDEDVLPQIYSSLPLFRWESNAELFKITVAEKMTGFHDNAAPEEIMNDRIRMEKFVRIVPGLGGATVGADTIVTSWNFLQYPSSGVFPLERGKTYYWQIIAYITAPGGTVELPSEIWGFRLAAGAADLLAPEQQQVLDYLISILGQDFLESFQAYGGDLEGYVPSGVVLKNGQVLSKEALFALIKRFRDGEITLVSVYIQ